MAVRTPLISKRDANRWFGPVPEFTRAVLSVALRKSVSTNLEATSAPWTGCRPGGVRASFGAVGPIRSVSRLTCQVPGVRNGRGPIQERRGEGTHRWQHGLKPREHAASMLMADRGHLPAAQRVRPRRAVGATADRGRQPRRRAVGSMVERDRGSMVETGGPLTRLLDVVLGA
jgi:hypothetical protein